MAFDKFSELDPAKMQRDIEEMHGSAFFDKYAVLDDAHRAQQIETTMGIEISNAAMSDPLRLMQEIVIAGQGDSSWVPANAKIHIDFVNNHAWSEAAGGEVAIDTLLGADANADNSWGGPMGYDSADLTPDGYVYRDMQACFIGAIRSMVLDSATIRYAIKQIVGAPSDDPAFVLIDATGDDAVELDENVANPDHKAFAYSWSGSFSTEISSITTNALGTVTVAAVTTSASRFDMAVNGSVAVAGTLDTTDRPPGNPFVSAFIDTGANQGFAIQSITIYDPLPTTAGLSELSAVT